LIKIDFSSCNKRELEDVLQQIDDRIYPERAIDIYLAMKKKNIARFDNQPELSIFDNELASHLFYSRSRLAADEEYQYQQRELSEKEQRVLALFNAEIT